MRFPPHIADSANGRAKISQQWRPEALLSYGVFGLLLSGPLAFGAVEPWAIFCLEAGAAGLLVWWAVQQAASGELHVTFNPLFVPMLVFAGLVLVQLFTGRTAYRLETVHGARLYAAYGVLCFLAVQSLRKKTQLKTLALAFSAYGFAMAMFALFQGFSANGKLYWIRTPRFGSWIYGPYVNHNHYAGLMEMLAPIPLVLALTRFAQGPRRTLALVAAGTMATTIFLSGSRGGMVAFGVQMALLGALQIRQKRGFKVALVAGAGLVLFAGVLTWLGGTELAKRLATIGTETHTELEGGMRMRINRDGLKMFQLKPLLGWGLGVFPDIYPAHRSFSTNLFINQAHDDYVQLLVETGALGFGTMMCFVLIMYYRAGRKLSDWPNDPNGALALAAVLGCTGILVHSSVDFNLQIPANAALFYVLCAVAALDARFSTSQRKVRVERHSDSELLVR